MRFSKDTFLGSDTVNVALPPLSSSLTSASESTIATSKAVNDLNSQLLRTESSIGNPNDFFAKQTNIINKMKHEFYGRGISIKSFGANEDGVKSDSKALTDAIASLNNKPGRIVFDGSKTYAFGSSVFIPYNVYLDFNGCVIIPVAGGTFTNNHMFHLNSKLADGASAFDFGGHFSPAICDAVFRNPNNVNVKVFLTKSRANFFRLSFSEVYGAITKVGSANKDYTDSLRFDNIFCVNCKGTDWLIDLQYNGDATHFSSCHMAGNPETANQNLIRMQYCNGGSIDRLINGNVHIRKCQAIRITNAHMEHGVFLIEASGVSFKDVFHWARHGIVPITVKGLESDKNPFPTTIENYCVQFPEFFPDYQQGYDVADLIDAVFIKTNVSIKNFYRHAYRSNDPVIGTGTAAKISIDGTTIWDKWENYSQMYAKSSYIAGNTIKTEMNSNMAHYIEAFGVNNGASSARLSNFTKDQVLHYRIATMYGPKDRQISRRVSTHSTTIAATGNYVSFNLPQNENYFGSIVRIYRGTEAGVYSHYVDVPYIFGFPIFDYGTYLATGERWKVIATPNGGDAFNNTITSYQYNGDLDLITAYGTAAPTQGSWKKGDRVVSTNILAGQPQGWVCSVEGKPGTWIVSSNY